MLPLNFNHLYYFYIVAEKGSFSQAAADLRISQSSISVQIKQFEAALGHTLFNRVKTGVELTESGQILYDHAEAIFHDIERIQNSLEAVEHQVRGTIDLGTVTSIGSYMLPDVLKAFHTVYPEVKITVAVQPSRELIDWVRIGRIDFALLTSNRQYPGLKGVPLKKIKLFLVAPADHPLAERETISPAELENYPFLGFDEGLELRMMMDALFRRMSLRIEYALSSSSVAMVKHMALAGLGLAILPETAVGPEIRDRRLVRLDVPTLYMGQEVTIYYKSSRPLTPTRQEFLETLREQLGGKRLLKR